MSEPSPPDPAEQLRQVKQHVDSLKRAGVEWLPAAPPLPEVPAAVPPVEAPVVPAIREAPPGDMVPAPVVPTVPLFMDSPASTPATEPLTPEQRRHELQVLAEKIAGCKRCAELVANRRQTVFGVGPIDVELCFVGEAPGFEEDRKGEPFVGPAGQLLDRIIAACGMKREQVYICNILKCRPPGNRTPLPNEAANCREYLDRQLELVKPKFICAMGACAVQNLLGTSVGITKLRGSFLDYRGIPVMCTFHPSYLLRVPEKKKDVWEDMQKLLQRMGRPIPGRGTGSS